MEDTRQDILLKTTNPRQDDRHSITNELQVDLFGNTKEILKHQDILSDNNYKLLMMFYLNQEINIGCAFLFKILHKNMSKRTIERFLEKARMCDWIEELKTIKGKVIQNNIFGFARSKDRYSNGNPVIDKRLKYYKITALGLNLFEKNNELKQ